MLEIEIIGVDNLTQLYANISEVLDNSIFQQAMIEGAMLVENRAKINLQEMIYSHPESWYSRKMGGGLLGATQASRVVEKERDYIVASVISNVFYAIFVHNGTGIFASEGGGRTTPWIFADDEGNFHKTVGQEPKPYLTKALRDSKDEIQILLQNAILKIASQTGGNI
jgi:hypothetical protein